jgi:hypothetical protein
MERPGARVVSDGAEAGTGTTEKEVMIAYDQVITRRSLPDR